MGLDAEELKRARRKYYEHTKHCEGKRDRQGNPVRMLLTFEQWIDIWLSSGHWHERGKRSGQYVMCRKDDLGDYEIGNVVIATCSENSRQYNVWRERKPPRLVEQKVRNPRKARVRKTEFRTPDEVRVQVRERMRRYRNRLNAHGVQFARDIPNRGMMKM